MVIVFANVFANVINSNVHGKDSLLSLYLILGLGMLFLPSQNTTKRECCRKKSRDDFVTPNA